MGYCAIRQTYGIVSGNRMLLLISEKCWKTSFNSMKHTGFVPCALAYIVCVCVCLYMCVYAYVYMCVYVCICVCMCMCVYMCVYVYVLLCNNPEECSFQQFIFRIVAMFLCASKCDPVMCTPFWNSAAYQHILKIF
jgi:hypothetical protein